MTDELHETIEWLFKHNAYVSFWDDNHRVTVRIPGQMPETANTLQKAVEVAKWRMDANK